MGFSALVAARYEPGIKGIFAVQDEISQAATEALH